jgi:hypothetical protein
MVRKRLEYGEHCAVTALFLIALAIPLAGTLTGRHVIESFAEQRALASVPAWPASAAAWRALPGGLSAWFDDHFGFRESLVALNERIVRAARLDSLSSIPVTEGLNGWLYFDGDRSLDDFRGQLRFTDAELAAWADALEARRRWLASRHISYLFVITPNKQSVYPEFLPTWLLDQRGVTRADQLVRYLDSHMDVPVLDLRPALLEEKGSMPLFRKYDSHWNARGAEIARRRILEMLSRIAPGMELPMWRTRGWGEERVAGGDLARMRGRKGVHEILPTWISDAPSCNPGISSSDRADGAHGTAVIDGCPAGAATALIFRDSFMIRLRPMLSPEFRRSIYLWLQPDTCQIRENVDRYGPDIVIEQRAERFLDAPRKSECD